MPRLRPPVKTLASSPATSAGGSGAPKLRWRKAGMRLLVSGLFLGVLFSLLDEGDLWERLKSFLSESPGAWFIGLAAFLGLHTISAWKWRLFLSLAGARISFLQAVRFYGSGLFANLCLPSLIGGDVLRAGLAMSVVEEKEAVLLGSVVDRFCDLLGLAALVALGAALAPGALDELSQNAISGRAILVVFVAILFGGALGGVLALRVRTLRRWPKPIARRLLEVLRALRTLRRRPLAALGGLMMCFSLQSGFVLVNVGLGSALGMDLDTRLWLLLWPLAKIVAMMPISLGGLGVREAAFAGLVSPFGIETELAVLQSLVWQSVLIAGGVLFGAFALVTGARLAGVKGGGKSGGAAENGD